MLAVQEGTLCPAAYSAICKARDLREYYLLAILAAADAITAQQNQYRIDSLVDLGLATCERPQTDDRPAQQVVTDEGRKRLGNWVQSPYTQQDIDELKDAVKSYAFEEFELPELSLDLTEKRAVMEAALADLARDPALYPAPARDPLTGHTLNELPAGVSTGLPSSANSADVLRSPEILQVQTRQVDEKIKEVKRSLQMTNTPTNEACFTTAQILIRPMYK